MGLCIWIRGCVGKCGVMYWDTGRFEKCGVMYGDMAKYGVMYGNTGWCREIWGDVWR